MKKLKLKYITKIKPDDGLALQQNEDREDSVNQNMKQQKLHNMNERN